MSDKIDQTIKGNNNAQTSITINGDCTIGINREEVYNIIRSFGYVNKDEIIDNYSFSL